MDWKLIKKGKNGEIHVNFFWVCLLVIFFGFLLGFGFMLAYTLVNEIYNGDGFYIYYFLKEYKLVILIVLVFWAFYVLNKKEDNKNEKT